MDCFKKNETNSIYVSKNFKQSPLFLEREVVFFCSPIVTVVASLSTLMEDWWISNFLKFNFTKRVYDSKKNLWTCEQFSVEKSYHQSSLSIIFSFLFKRLFPHPLFKVSSWKKSVSEKLQLCGLPFDEKKKKFLQKHFGLIFVWKRFRDWFKTSKPLPKNDAFPKRNDCNLCGKNNSFTKMMSCAK